MKKHFYISIASFFISSLTIWFMPLTSFEGSGTEKSISFALAIGFWLFFLVGLLFFIPIGKARKNEGFHSDGLPFLRFFKNTPGMVFDCLSAAGLLIFIVTVFITAIPAWISTAALFTLVFSFEMHGMFNGKNYEYLSKTKVVPRISSALQ